MPDWNPTLYRQFEAERTRPALELLSRIPLTAPARITDLGCGPGNSTQGLHERFAQAAVTGIDSSAAMLDDARARLPHCRFSQEDITAWRPAAAQDIIYANASLQWVADHETLFPRLFSLTAPGGCLAVQMPDNRDEPSHGEMRRIAQEMPWRQYIGEAAGIRVRILRAQQYYDLLAPEAVAVDIWRTTYFHVMPSVGAIVEWLRATGLRPFLERLDATLQSSFIERYRQALVSAYPARADGTVLLAFPRLFIVATRPG
ncbi:trans-aconitate 2-methyltransferase [Acerihabitans sp.]|uniref:trans-aconitate 2-methyltransferase n=1 Tax=Acerihabitans sp. TaxID=2811394 RepID=UPI002ED77596